MIAKTVSMKTLARFFIAASVVSFASSLTGAGGEFLWGFLKPLSALLFGAFFISNLLAKEYARYDEEHEYRMGVARKRRGEAPVDNDSAPSKGVPMSCPPGGESDRVEGERSAELEEHEAVSLRDDG